MIAVIAGATGLVGDLLLDKLLQNPAIKQVVSVSRKSLQRQNDKLKEIIINDFADLAKVREQLKGDLYFCALGTTIKKAGSQANFRKVDFDAICEFAKIAKSFEARCFALISASGANAKSKIFYNQVKGETENFVKGLSLSRLVIFRPALLMGKRKEFRLAEGFFIGAMNVISPILPRKVEKMIMTPVEKLAQQIIDKSNDVNSGTFIFEAKDID